MKWIKFTDNKPPKSQEVTIAKLWQYVPDGKKTWIMRQAMYHADQECFTFFGNPGQHNMQAEYWMILEEPEKI